MKRENLVITGCKNGVALIYSQDSATARALAAMGEGSFRALSRGGYVSYGRKNASYSFLLGDISYVHCRNGQAQITGSYDRIAAIAGVYGGKPWYVKSRNLWRVRLPKGGTSYLR